MRKTYYISDAAGDLSIFTFTSGQLTVHRIFLGNNYWKKGDVGPFNWLKDEVIGHPFNADRISRDEARHLLGKHFVNIP